MLATLLSSPQRAYQDVEKLTHALRQEPAVEAHLDLMGSLWAMNLNNRPFLTRVPSNHADLQSALEALLHVEALCVTPRHTPMISSQELRSVLESASMPSQDALQHIARVMNATRMPAPPLRVVKALDAACRAIQAVFQKPDTVFELRSAAEDLRDAVRAWTLQRARSPHNDTDTGLQHLQPELQRALFVEFTLMVQTLVVRTLDVRMSAAPSSSPSEKSPVRSLTQRLAARFRAAVQHVVTQADSGVFVSPILEAVRDAGGDTVQGLATVREAALPSVVHNALRHVLELLPKNSLVSTSAMYMTTVVAALWYTSRVRHAAAQTPHKHGMPWLAASDMQTAHD